MKQKECVFNAVTQVMGVVEGEYKPNKEQRLEIIGLITESIVNGETDYGKVRDNVVEVRTYSNGLLSNWLRKDTRLNGGVEYEIKNPGSRTGSTDPVIKEMKKLRANLIASGMTEQVKVLDQAIADKIAQLPTKAKKTITIDMSKIPEDVQMLLTKLDSQK